MYLIWLHYVIVQGAYVIIYDTITLADGYKSSYLIRMENTEWEAKAKGLLKAELKRKGVTYAQLVERLDKIGVKETEPNIRNKLSRGKFTAVFMLQVLGAIECRSLALTD